MRRESHRRDLRISPALRQQEVWIRLLPTRLLSHLIVSRLVRPPMPTQFVALPARFVRFAVAATVAISFLGVDCLRAAPIFSVGAKETVYSASKRKSKAASWPDGNFGVLSNGDGTYDFYAANSSKIKVSSGPLTDPAAKKIGTGKIWNIPKKTYSYVAGGPVYEDRRIRCAVDGLSRRKAFRQPVLSRPRPGRFV